MCSHSGVARVACTNCATSSPNPPRVLLGKSALCIDFGEHTYGLCPAYLHVLTRTEPGGRDLSDEVVGTFIVPGFQEDFSCYDPVQVVSI